MTSTSEYVEIASNRATSESGHHHCSPACDGVFDDFSFALCLTHDVDRVDKKIQAPYYTLLEGRPSHLKSLFTNERPYWQFEEIMEIEDSYDVRSSFFFLQEKQLFRDIHPRKWLTPHAWSRYVGYYDLNDPDIIDIMRTLEAGGWEVGLHGSFDSYLDKERLLEEKQLLETLLGHPVTGVRQHYLNLEIPHSWEIHREIGLRYDASLGSSVHYGLDVHIDDGNQIGPRVFRPFHDEFLVFPLNVMDVALVDPAPNIEHAWVELKSLLEGAWAADGLVTVLWHPRLFNQDEFPGYRTLYERMLSTALEMDAWVGPLEDAYCELTRARCTA